MTEISSTNPSLGTAVAESLFAKKNSTVRKKTYSGAEGIPFQRWKRRQPKLLTRTPTHTPAASFRSPSWEIDSVSMVWCPPTGKPRSPVSHDLYAPLLLAIFHSSPMHAYLIAGKHSRGRSGAARSSLLLGVQDIKVLVRSIGRREMNRGYLSVQENNRSVKEAGPRTRSKQEHCSGSKGGVLQIGNDKKGKAEMTPQGWHNERKA